MKNNKIKVLALVGKSGSGKDSLIKKITETNNENIHRIISTTTRPPREGEIDGKDYYFVSHDAFLDMMDKQRIAEVSVFNNWCYGTQIKEFKPNAINIGIFDPFRLAILDDYPDIDLKVGIVYATDKERLLRQLQREEEPDVKEIIRRFQADEEDFEAINDDFSIVNIPNHDNQLDKAYENILSIVEDWVKFG